MKSYLAVAALAVVLAATLPGGRQAPPHSKGENMAALPGAPYRPFPQHARYTPGSILPDCANQSGLDAAVTSFYAAWKAAYLRAGCGEGRYYVYVGDSVHNGIAVSEGQGFGMIITALLAGHDPEAQAIFDGLFAFFRDHPSENNPHLMAWKQIEGCSNTPDGAGSATDGDMDLAYALLLAHEQWGSAGTVNYLSEARQVIAALWSEVVNPETKHLMLGDWVSTSNPKFYYGGRTSDFMPGHLRAYRQASGEAGWQTTLDKIYTLASSLQSQNSPGPGLLPDFYQDTPNNARPADPYFLETDHDGQYYYNACRDAFRLGVDYLLSGDPRPLALLKPLNTWIQQQTGGDPSKIVAGYTLDGSPLADYETLAFSAPLGVSALIEAGNQAWLNALWQRITSLEIGQGGYYGDTLKMLALIVMSGNWWSPGDEPPSPKLFSVYAPLILQ